MRLEQLEESEKNMKPKSVKDLFPGHRVTAKNTLAHETLFTVVAHCPMGVEDPEPGSHRESVEVVGRFESEHEALACLNQAHAEAYEANDEFSYFNLLDPDYLAEAKAVARAAKRAAEMLNSDCPF